MLTIKKIIQHSVIFCKELNAVIFYTDKSYSNLPASTGTYLYCVQNQINIIGLDRNLENYYQIHEVKKLDINLIIKLITYIKNNGYIEKLRLFYSSYKLATRNSEIVICTKDIK